LRSGESRIQNKSEKFSTNNQTGLCEEMERDPRGRPYKAIMIKLNRRQQIIGLEKPGRLKNIVKHLFPRKLDGASTPALQANDNMHKHTEITEAEEILEEATRLANGKSPGPHGIINELLQSVVKWTLNASRTYTIDA